MNAVDSSAWLGQRDLASALYAVAQMRRGRDRARR